jgi:hypothetical protein
MVLCFKTIDAKFNHTISQQWCRTGEVAAKLLIDRLESNEENIPYETVVG